MSSPGDWMCGACQHINFKKRDACQKCVYSKYGEPINNVSVYGYSSQSFEMVKAGDWYCGTVNCGSHNYAGRSSCYRCGATKNGFGYDGGALPAGWKTGDWICTRPGCSMHNYASRMECYKCKTQRDYGGAV